MIFPKVMFRNLFAWSEALLASYPKPAPMSSLSRRLISSMNLKTITQIRRRNFRFLLSRLEQDERLVPLYAALPDGVCPLGFPVLAEDRDGLVQHLIEHHVYPPIHWELPKEVDSDQFPEAWSVSDHILTLPVDQRYDEDHMGRVVDIIKSYQPAKVVWATGR